MEYLGHVILRARVATNQYKIQAIRNWPIPSNLKQLRGFLGLLGYYRRFIKDYAKISDALTKLLKGGTDFSWNKEAEVAFITLKQAITSASILALPNYQLPFITETDASGSGIGVVLMQQGHHLAYISKVLAPRHQSLLAYSFLPSFLLLKNGTHILLVGNL